MGSNPAQGNKAPSRVKLKPALGPCLILCLEALMLIYILKNGKIYRVYDDFNCQMNSRKPYMTCVHNPHIVLLCTFILENQKYYLLNSVIFSTYHLMLDSYIDYFFTFHQDLQFYFSIMSGASELGGQGGHVPTHFFT